MMKKGKQNTKVILNQDNSEYEYEYEYEYEKERSITLSGNHWTVRLGHSKG